MKSRALPSFWKAYQVLSSDLKPAVRKSYHLWIENPFHPTLHFKCINRDESVWSVRITKGFRAVGILEGDEVTWFWIGNHDDYEQFFR